MERAFPPVEFSTWCPWPARGTLACRTRPGIYLLALDIAEGEPVSTLDRRIVYIGETCRELARRWRYFEYAVTTGDAPHTGGKSYRRTVKRPLSQLLVAAWAPDLEPKVLRNAYLRYVERKLILQWVSEHDALPICNAE